MAAKISVLIPTYNGTRYLRECMDSVVGQTFGDFEVLVVDDGSTDGTLDLLGEYARKDNRIRLFANRKNLGLVANWNRAMELASGEWIKFVFQDDTITCTCLRDLLEAANASGTAFAFGRRDFMFDKTVRFETIEKYQRAAAEIERLFPADGFTDSTRFCQMVLSRSDRNFIGEPVVALFRRELANRVGRFNRDLIVFCDMEYWMRLGVNAGATHVAKKVASFRIHGESTTAKSVRDRHFRMFVLDHAVVSHEMVFHAAFAPLRAEARRSGVDLHRKLEERIAWARAQAAAAGDAAQRMRELQELEAAYPHIRRLSARQRGRRRVKRLLAGVRSLLSGKRFGKPVQ